MVLQGCKSIVILLRKKTKTSQRWKLINQKGMHPPGRGDQQLFEKIKVFLKNQKHEPNIVEVTHMCIMHGVHTSIYNAQKEVEMKFSCVCKGHTQK
jgi:hypothetical protein